MLIYVDSSVVLARLLAEHRQPSPSFWDEVLVSSRLLEYEVWIRTHAARVQHSGHAQITALLGKIDMIEMSVRALGRALQPFSVPLRTLDALHLATALFLSTEGDPVHLASYDDRMIAAARAMGIDLAAL